MKNHFSPKAPQTASLAANPFFGLHAAFSVATPLLRNSILSLPRSPQRLVEPVAPEKPPPVRQTALFAHEGLHRAAPVRQTALFAHETLIRPLPCAKPPYLLTTNEYNAGWPHFLHSFKSCRKSSSQEYATGGSMVFFGTGRSIDPSPPAILAIFSIRSAGSSGLKKATLPHPADVS